MPGSSVRACSRPISMARSKMDCLRSDSAAWARIRSKIRWYTRGTLVAVVGSTSWMSSETVSVDSA